MTRAQAKRLGAALGAAGVIEFPTIGSKLPRGLRRTHGASSITGHWARSLARRAPRRATTIVCADVAEALLGGWSVAALRACSHTPAAIASRSREAIAA